jgi:glycosyltransferase involved in cell wall biosynthesis
MSSLSVLICVYAKDDPEAFREAYESILSQNELPDEIVLVLDGPIGQNLEIQAQEFLNQAAFSKIKFKTIRLKYNVGHGKARMAGLMECQSEYVAICDADDINKFDRFYKQKTYLDDNPSISVVGSQIVEIDHLTKQEIGRKTVPFSFYDLQKYMRYRCPLNQMSVMFKKSDVLAAGGYQDFYHNEDYFLWIRMFLKGYKFENLPDFLVLARVNGEFYDRRGGWKYFLSEFKIQKILLSKRINNPIIFIFNLAIRAVLQVLLPAKLRGKIFKMFFRE